MVKRRKKTSPYGWIIAVVLLAALASYLLNGYLAQQRYKSVNTVAVVNKSTNEIVWIGASQLCVPAAPNTYLVSDCMKEGSGDICGGAYYSVSPVGIYCGSNIINATAVCGVATPKPIGENQSYVCAFVGQGHWLLWTRNNTTSNFTLDSIGNNSATITVKGWCGSCANSPPSSYNYTLTLNQTADTACATGTSLQLIAVNGNYALLVETEFKNQGCF